jgi:uncharacterized protein involved in outer membrane biogenesis
MAKKLLIVLAVLVAVAAFLLARDWDSPEIGQAVIDKVNEATGVNMTAGSFRLNLLKGVVLGDVKASKIQDGRKVDLTVEQFVVEHRVLPLLTGTVALDRVVIDKPQVEIVEPGPAGGAESGSGDKPAAAEKAEAASKEQAAAEPSGFTLEVRQISIRDGQVVIRREGDDSQTRIQGLEFNTENLAIDPDAGTLTGITADGNLKVNEIALGNFKITNTRGRYSLAGGKFDLPELAANMAKGQVSATGAIDFNPVPYIYQLSVQGTELDMQASGAGSSSRDLEAKGSVALAAGTLPDAPVLKDIDRSLGKQVVVGAAYQATRADFTIADNIATLSPFRFETERARVDTSGKADLDGPLDLDLSVATPREGIRIGGVGSDVLDLLADEQGWVPVPMTVTGTVDDPKVRPDAKALLSQASKGYKRGLTKDLEEKASGLLEGLFRKKT